MTHPSATIYVDPVAGNDSNPGWSWDTAKRTIQAAVDAAPRCGEVVLAPGAHVVGAGVHVADVSKALTVTGVSPLASRQHADKWSKLPHIRSGLKGDDRPDSLFRIGTPESPHVYGWTFRNIYLDADSVAPGGFGFDTHGLNKALFQDVSARALDGESRHLVRADAGAGDDASWWHFRDVNTTGLGLAVSKQGNYWSFANTNIHGPRNKMAAPALSLEGTQHDLSGLNMEMWGTAVHAIGVRGLMAHGLRGESVDVMIHMVGCYDSNISLNSAAGWGRSEVVDENGYRNTVIGADHRKTGTTTGGMSFGEYGVTFAQTAAGSANLLHGSHPVRFSPGVELLPEGMYDIAAAGPLTAEYWDGEQWAAWDVNTTCLPVANPQAVTIDAAHKRVRFRTRNLSRAVKGLAVAHTGQPQGGATRYTFRVLNWSGTRVLEEHTTTAHSPAQVRGATVSFSEQGAVFEFEADFGITGDQTATISGLHLFTPAPDQDMPGKQLRGHATPEGNIHGTPGDTYHSTGDPGIWVHAGPAGLTGWRKLAYA